MPRFLPLRASVEWLRKTAKQRLETLRASDPDAQLSDAQLAVAREYGHASWRALVAHVEQVREKLRELIPADAEPLDGGGEEGGSGGDSAGESIRPDDAEVAALFAAIQAADVARVTELLRGRPALAAARGPGGATPLHAAAQCNDARLAIVLLAFGADPAAKFGESGHSALSWAGTCYSLDFARTLVRLGVVPDLFEAAGMGSLEDVQRFFDPSGRLIEGASRTGSTRFGPDGGRLACPPAEPVEVISDALAMACRNGHAEVARLLLRQSPDLGFRGYLGATPLHWAYFGGSREVIDLLLAAGADPSARDHELKCTPKAFGICTAANWGFLFIVEKLLQRDPTLLNHTDGQTTALHEAAGAGHAEVARYLLQQGADASLRDNKGQTPLERAVAAGRADTAAVLREIG